MTAARGRILVVEDEGLVALSLQKRLEALGYEVVGTAASGEEAVALTERTHPDLVLMDVRLQGPSDGIEAGEEIRRRWGAAILYLTAHSDERTVGRAARTHPVGYLLKPFDDRQLHTAVRVGLVQHAQDLRSRSEEGRLGTILRSLGDGVIAADADGKVTYLNPLAQRLTGWSEVDAIGRDLADVFRVLDVQSAALNPVTQGVRPGGAVGPTTLVAKDGTHRQIDDCAALWTRPEGVPRGIVVTFRDVSERRRVEAALRRSEALRASIVEAAPDGILVVDRDGRIVASNPAAERCLRRDAASFVGASLRDLLFPAALRDALGKALASPAASGRRLRGHVARGDGTTSWAELTVLPLPVGGPEHFVVFLRDLDRAAPE